MGIRKASSVRACVCVCVCECVCVFACGCGRRSHKIDHVFGRHAGVPNFVEQSVANACLNAVHEGTVLACFKASLVQTVQTRTHQVSSSRCPLHRLAMSLVLQSTMPKTSGPVPSHFPTLDCQEQLSRESTGRRNMQESSEKCFQIC